VPPVQHDLLRLSAFYAVGRTNRKRHWQRRPHWSRLHVTVLEQIRRCAGDRQRLSLVVLASISALGPSMGSQFKSA